MFEQAVIQVRHAAVASFAFGITNIAVLTSHGPPLNQNLASPVSSGQYS